MGDPDFLPDELHEMSKRLNEFKRQQRAGSLRRAEAEAMRQRQAAEQLADDAVKRGIALSPAQLDSIGEIIKQDNAGALTPSNPNDTRVWGFDPAHEFELAEASRKADVETKTRLQQPIQTAPEDRKAIDNAAFETWTSIQDLAAKIDQHAPSDHPVRREMRELLERMEKIRGWTEGMAMEKPG